MAWQIEAYKIDADGRIRVKHTFYGESEAEADRYFEEHQQVCRKFGPAVSEGNVITISEEVDEIPTPESIAEEIEEDVT